MRVNGIVQLNTEINALDIDDEDILTVLPLEH